MLTQTYTASYKRGWCFREQPEAQKLSISSSSQQRHQNYPLAIFLNHLPVGADGVAGKMIIFQYVHFTSAFCRSHTVGYVYYCQPRKKCIYGGNHLSKRKRESDQTDSFQHFLFFSSTVSLKTGRLTKKSKRQTK